MQIVNGHQELSESLDEPAKHKGEKVVESCRKKSRRRKSTCQQPTSEANETNTNTNSNSNLQPSVMRRVVSKLNRKRCCIKDKLSESLNRHFGQSWDDMEYAERQNSVTTLELFKYAERRERLAVISGICFMWYAASWQPISVFILAIMAQLMGQYSKRINWLSQLTSLNSSSELHSSDLLVGSTDELPGAQVANSTSSSHYSNFPLLTKLYKLIGPILGQSLDWDQQQTLDGSRHNLEVAIRDLTANESNQFLRRSLEINASAFALALTQLVSFFLGMLLITWAAKKQASRLKILYFKSSLRQEVTWFEAIDSASGSGSSLNGLVDKYEDGIGMKLALLSYFLGHVGLFAMTAFYQMFQLAAFCMPFVLLVGLLISYLSKWQAVAIGQHALFAKRSLQLAEEIIAAIRTVFAFSGQQKEISRYSVSLEPVYRKSLVKHLYTALNTSLSKFSIFACFACYCFYAMRLFPPYSHLALDKATVLAVLRGAEVSIVNILISIPFLEALQQSKGSIARIYAAIERRSKIDPAASSGLELAANWQPSISFKMVQFGYADRSGPTRRRSTLPFLNLAGSPGSGQQPLDGSEPNVASKRRGLIEELASELELQRASDTPTSQRKGARRPSDAIRRMLGSEIDKAAGNNERILNYFNLEIKAGQSVALVGASGSGKSTVLSLIQRLYDVTGGQLLLGGQHNVKELGVAWLRRQIGAVTQEPRLFDMSIADNIMLGLTEEQLAEAQQTGRLAQQVREAALASGAHEFIAKLPNGYQTRVGSAGVQLSGGQKQRIAIARALIRRPKILLLDESTSALDTESEAKVQEALKAASKGRTTVTVAHRLATIKHVDLIVVMSQGQVMESGSHDELMARSSSIYRQMYEMQLNSAPEPAQDEQQDFSRVRKKSPICKFSQLDANQLEKHQDEDEAEEDDYEDDNSSESSGSSSEQTGWQIWRFVDIPRWSSIASVLVCLLAGLILPMNLIGHSYLFSAFAYSELEQIGDYLHVFGLVILSFSSLVFVISFLQVILPGYVGEKLSVRLRVKTMDSLLNKPMFYFDMNSNSAGALCNRFNSYISSVQSIAGTRIATMLEALSTLTAGALFGFGQNLSLSLFCLMFALLVLGTTIIESRILQREASLQQKFDAQLAHLMADALSNIKTIASLNKENFFIQQFSQMIAEREVGLGTCKLLLRTFLTSLKFVMPAMSWSASMYYGSYLLVKGSIDLQTIFIVCPVVLFAVNDTFRALVFLPELLKARKSLERLHRLNLEFSPQSLQSLTLSQQLEQQNQLHLSELAQSCRRQSAIQQAQSASSSTSGRKSISFAELPSVDVEPNCGGAESPSGGRQVNRRVSSNLPSYMRRKQSRLNSLVPKAQLRGRIEFKDVAFAYPNRPSALVLEGFSLSVAPGESVALVGSSGSGKSTCVAILEKFYDYHEGRVSVDGNDLRLVESRWVRSQLGLVSQEPTLLSYTIGDNIRYGDNARFVPMDEVVEAARTANIHDFIMSLPDQYDTELSSSTYSSSQLSGGQRQRIAIARALIRNAPILIFDEATSALDTRNESVVQDALNKARKGRTSLVIAHRLATICDADKIVVLKDGRVVESGRHEELLGIPAGHYRSLWERQERAATSNTVK